MSEWCREREGVTFVWTTSIKNKLFYKHALTTDEAEQIFLEGLDKIHHHKTEPRKRVMFPIWRNKCYFLVFIPQNDESIRVITCYET